MTERIALLLILSSMTLFVCGTIATTAAVGQTAAAFGLAVTRVAMDGAVLVGKGVVKTGEVAVGAVKGGT